MPNFFYKAKTKTAQNLSGLIVAHNREEAVEVLSQRGLLPVSVTEESSAFKGRGTLSPRLSSKELYFFSRQLTSLLNAGVSLLRALEIIGGQLKSSAGLRMVVDHLAGGIKEGRTLSTCLADFPQVFSSLYVTMIHAGEESGNLREVLASLAEYQMRQQEINSKVRTALAYPLLMLVFGIGTVIFLLTFVMPRITALFGNLQSELPAVTVFLMMTSEALRRFWYLILAGVVGLGFLVRQWAQSKPGQAVLSRLNLKWPILGQLILKTELARFCRTLELLLHSGIPILRSFQITLPVLRNDVIREHLARCQDELVAGHSFGGALKRSDVIPPIVGDLITVGEESGSLTTTLKDISETYEQETNEIIKLMTTLLEPILILAVGSVIGFIVMAILLPIFQLDVMST